MNLNERSSKFHVAHSAVHVHLEKCGYSLYLTWQKILQWLPLFTFTRVSISLSGALHFVDKFEIPGISGLKEE